MHQESANNLKERMLKSMSIEPGTSLLHSVSLELTKIVGELIDDNVRLERQIAELRGEEED
jgi:hypothetical protein